MIVSTTIKEVCVASCRTCEKRTGGLDHRTAPGWVDAHIEMLPGHVVEVDERAWKFYYETPRPQDALKESE